MPGNPNPYPAGRFSRANQPRNRGRKKSLHKQVAYLAKIEFNETLSSQDINQIFQSMIERTVNELIDIYNDLSKPMFIRIIANALLKGCKKGDNKSLKLLFKYS